MTSTMTKLLPVYIFIIVCSGLGYAHNTKIRKQWGYVDVRQGAHMFWWLYYANVSGDGYLSRPLVLWLQGGPGSSSTGYGNFLEIGPLTINGHQRNETWVKEVNVLFVDSPVGSGFSYVDGNKTSLLCTNNSQVARDLIAFTIGFLAKVPEFSSVPFYVFSESYGGKMAVEYVHMLSKLIESGKIKAALKGVVLGDPWISPVDSISSWAPYLYEMGIVDSAGRKKIEKWANHTRDIAKSGNWSEAIKMFSKTEDAVEEASYDVNFSNILKPTSRKTNTSVKLNSYIGSLYHRHISDGDDETLYTHMNGAVKESLRVIPKNVSWGSMRKAVFKTLSLDFMRPVTDIVEALLNGTRLSISVYSGQLDLVVSTSGTLKWVENLKWAGSKRWMEAQRKPLVVSGYIEGYTKSMKHFSFYWINRAGNMVPKDNPSAALAMLKAITSLK